MSSHSLPLLVFSLSFSSYLLSLSSCHLTSSFFSHLNTSLITTCKVKGAVVFLQIAQLLLQLRLQLGLRRLLARGEASHAAMISIGQAEAETSLHLHLTHAHTLVQVLRLISPMAGRHGRAATCIRMRGEATGRGLTRQRLTDVVWSMSRWHLLLGRGVLEHALPLCIIIVQRRVPFAFVAFAIAAPVGRKQRATATEGGATRHGTQQLGASTATTLVPSQLQMVSQCASQLGEQHLQSRLTAPAAAAVRLRCSR